MTPRQKQAFSVYHVKDAAENAATSKKCGDFPGGPVVENPSCNAVDATWIPGWGTKIPHAEGQLSPHTTTIEPECANTEPTRSAAHAPQLERSQRTATKSPHAANTT